MPNYNQNWNGADPNALCAGTFVCTITDSNSCVLSVSNTVIEPSQLTAQIIQNVNDLDAIANGGTLPYTFVWNTVETTPTITPTQNGTYWLIVSDNNGCTSDTVFIILDDFKLVNNDIESMQKRFYVMSSRAREKLFLFRSAVRPSVVDDILPKPGEIYTYRNEDKEMEMEMVFGNGNGILTKIWVLEEFSRKCRQLESTVSRAGDVHFRRSFF